MLYLSKSKAQDATIMDLRTINNKDARSQIYHLERLDIIFFFSLDIEGAEYEVLKTVPWDKVDIEVLLIELIHAGSLFKGSREEIHQFLLSKNYVYLGTICTIFHHQNYIIIFFVYVSAADDVFVRKDLLKTKYDFVDFAGAEKYHNWCTHYSQCTLSCQTISMKMTSLIETPKTNWDP